jgi:hypothetical protein
MRTITIAILTASALAACEQQKQPPQQQQDAAPKFTVANFRALPKAADGAEGSGCLADAGPLPDGAWFGFVRAWDQSGIDLDPACFYTGAAAAKEAAARNEESPPPNDFFIANDSKAVRRIPVAPGAAAIRVTHNKDGGVTMDQRTTYADLITNPGTYQRCPDEFCTVWIYVNGGAATEVQMQYLP